MPLAAPVMIVTLPCMRSATMNPSTVAGGARVAAAAQRPCRWSTQIGWGRPSGRPPARRTLDQYSLMPSGVSIQTGSLRHFQTIIQIHRSAPMPRYSSITV